MPTVSYRNNRRPCLGVFANNRDSLDNFAWNAGHNLVNNADEWTHFQNAVRVVLDTCELYDCINNLANPGDVGNAHNIADTQGWICDLVVIY